MCLLLSGNCEESPGNDSLSSEHIVHIPAPALWLMPISSRCPCPIWPAQEGYVPASLISPLTSRLPFPGQCCLSPLNSCSPHCLPNTCTTWCIFSGMDKHLLYPISENRLSVPSLQVYLSPFLSLKTTTKKPFPDTMLRSK